MEAQTAEGLLSHGEAALAAGRWSEALSAFEESLSVAESAPARFGVAEASWWLGATVASVVAGVRAYGLFRRDADVAGAVRCAVWLGITYKSNFGNFVAANGWLARADRLLGEVEPGPLHAWAWIARAYRSTDLAGAEQLTRRAVDLARAAGDADAELVGLSQLGLVAVAGGDTTAGFDLIDEAMAAALGGETARLDTVVYVACDMLNACDLAADDERAAKWCKVADDFIARYGCPFLNGECRILYGGVLVANGSWSQAELELTAALRITTDTAPDLSSRALARLAGLRVRQGRLEEAGRLLDEVDQELVADEEAVLCRAALQLATGDEAAACRLLEGRLDRWARHRSLLAGALELLVPAQLAAGEQDAAAASAERLAAMTIDGRHDRVSAAATTAHGRVAAAAGNRPAATTLLETAVASWSRLGLPYEAACCALELARVLSPLHSELAIENARRALATFDVLGADLHSNMAGALLRSMGATARSGVRSTGGLTNREQEVLQLLSLGLSNPEIAQRLFVSRRTAGHHVSSILSKLRLRNRAEAAAYAQRVTRPAEPHS